MAWPWWDDDLGLLSFTSSSTFISTSNLHLLSLVLLHSCSFRERGRGWEMGEWIGLVLLQLRFGVSILSIWHVGPSVEWRIAHSPLTACSSVTDRWSGYHIRLFGGLWTRGIGPNTWDLAVGPIHLFQGLITWPVTSWVEMMCSSVIVLTITDFRFIQLAGRLVE